MKKLAHILIFLAACLVLAAPAAAQLDEWAMPAVTTWEGHAPELVWGWSAEHHTLRPFYGGPEGRDNRATERTVVRNGRVETVGIEEPAFGDALDIQPPATNELPYATAIDNAAWIKTHASVEAAIAPDGTSTAFKLVENTDDSSHGLYASVTLDDDTNYTYSIYIKAGERSVALIQWKLKDGSYPYAYFNASTGVMGTVALGDGGGSEYIGDGWYRVWIADNSATGAEAPMCRIYLCQSVGTTAYPGDGSSGFYIWLPQMEAGTVPTAPIPTPGASTVSRAGDGVNWDLPQPIKNIASVEEPTPTAVLTQTAGAIVLATVAGGAFAAPDGGSGVNLSPYADGGYILKVTDTSGKTAWTRIGAAGSGLAFSAELVNNGDFANWTGDNPDNWTLYGTETGANYVTENPAGSCQIVSGDTYIGVVQMSLSSIGYLYKISADVSSITTSVGVSLSGSIGSYTGTGNGQTIYATANGTNLYFVCYPGRDVTLDNVSLKAVTAPPATGVWLESTAGAGDKTWSYIQSGFDPNSISTWSVIPASQWRARGMLLVEGFVPGWNQADDSHTGFKIISSGSAPLLYLHAASGDARTYDGSTIVYVSMAWVAGTSYDFAVRWDSASNIYQVGYKLSTATTWTWSAEFAFDGAYPFGSTLEIGASIYAPFQVRRVRFFNAPLSPAQLAWMDDLDQWVAAADDYYPARAVGGM